MSKVCEITGKRAMSGNNVSFSINKTKRRFNVNLSKKRFYIPEEDRWVTLKVSAKALKIINKKRRFCCIERRQSPRIGKIS